MSCRNKIFVRKQLGPQALLWKSLSVVNTLHKYSLNCPRMSFVQNSLHSASQPWQMWDQHVETSPSPGLHQTFICNSLHNGIVVKPTQNSDSILIRSYVPSGQFSVLFTGLWWIKHCVYVTRHISATLRDIRDTQTVSRDTETPPACVGTCPHLFRSASTVYIILQIGCKM